MRKGLITALFCCAFLTGVFSGCGQEGALTRGTGSANGSNNEGTSNIQKIVPTKNAEELEEGLSVIKYEGDYGFDTFLEQGGADSDASLIQYLISSLSDKLSIQFDEGTFGCSTLSIKGTDGGYLFGRNFDWVNCNGWIVSAKPENGYSSVSTVNMDFIKIDGVDISVDDSIKAIVGLYAPLDGMNEKGLAVSVNMIQDTDRIEQDTDKPDLTTTTAVRLLLDKAATVDEAVELLGQYDVHSSMDKMVHFAIADADGNSVVVEYIDNEMKVTKTSAVTNFYLTEGEKYGIGTEQSHERYNILMDTLEKNTEMDEMGVRDVLDSVSKDNFDEFKSTEWSIVMNQQTKELTYFHREDYQKGYSISIE